ncbi:MAG: HD domain-containing protein, partial [Candidatus Babeliales bacterium]
NDELTIVCKKMDISSVSRERIEEEFKKMFLKSRLPSRGIRWLHAIGRLVAILPELFAMVKVPQNPQWHAEGDAFEHTMQTVDAAARIVKIYDNQFKKLLLLYAALCHDLGKPTTTEKINGVYKSIGHEKEGVKFAKQLLKNITEEKVLIAAVVKLVRYHMVPLQLVTNNAGFAAYKRLANKLSPQATLYELANLFFADRQGRNPRNAMPLKKSDPDVAIFIQMADKAQVLAAIEKPILQGRDLLDIVEPGPYMGKLLKKAYQIQIEKNIRDKEELKQRILVKED